MSLRTSLSNAWHRFQWDLSPAPAEEIGPVLESHKTRVRVLDLVELERFVATCSAAGIQGGHEVAGHNSALARQHAGPRGHRRV